MQVLYLDVKFNWVFDAIAFIFLVNTRIFGCKSCAKVIFRAQTGQFPYLCTLRKEG